MNVSLILASTLIAVCSYVLVPLEQWNAAATDNSNTIYAGSAVGCGSPMPVASAPIPVELAPPAGTVINVTGVCCSSWTIDGMSSPTLILTRGETYLFTVSGSGHPFFLRNSAGGTNVTVGVTNNGAQTGTVTFVPDVTTPANLVYQCGFHPSMLGSITVVNPSIKVSPKAFLEGAYDASTGLMSDVLRTVPTFPLTEPYTALGYAHVGGGGGETVAPVVLAVIGGDAIVDWVVVELRGDANPSQIVATRSALLQSDGDVVSTNGTSPVSLAVAPGNYHVALRHRNHLGVMALNSVTLSAVTTVVDLSAASTACYGTGARKSVTGSVPAEVMWAGDVTFNGTLQYTGANNDRDPVLVTIGSTTPNNVVSTTYSTRDVNLNGNVQYTGSGNDRDPILVNVGSTTPNNVRVQQLP